MIARDVWGYWNVIKEIDKDFYLLFHPHVLDMERKSNGIRFCETWFHRNKIVEIRK